MLSRSNFSEVMLIFALLCAVMADSTHQIHKRMTPEERLQVFQTQDENVQQYEVVPIHWPRLQKRSPRIGTGIRMKAFGEDIKLWLTPSDGMLAGHDTPVYLLNQKASGPTFARYSNVMQHLEQYENLKNSAVVVARRSGNSRRLVGTIGSHNLVIAPIPERLVPDVRRQRRSTDDISESDQDDHHYHIIYNRPLPAATAQYLDELLSDIPTNFTAESSPIPDTVYPEILVVVSNDLFMKLGGNFWEVVAYMVVFWNGVDLKFRSLESPKFRLNIAGIVLTQDAQALPYISNHEFDENSLVGDRALRSSSDFWLAQDHEIPVESYDALVTMTSRKMCSYGRQSNCQFGVLGLAYVGGACNMGQMYQTMSKVAIVADSGGFDGIHSTAHELGHLFGASHDGQVNKNCSFGGHIMTPGIPMNRSPDWSNCTLNDFQTFLNKGPVCLYNNPTQMKVLPRYLPGKLMDADEQCKRFAGTRACNIDYSICGRLGCVIEGDSKYCIQILGGAADGTTCGSGQICLHGRCLDEEDVL